MKKKILDWCWLSKGDGNPVTEKAVLLFYYKGDENYFNEIMMGNRWQRASN